MMSYLGCGLFYGKLFVLTIERSDLVCFWMFMVVLSIHGEAGSCSPTSVIVCCLLPTFLSRPCLRRHLTCSKWGICVKWRAYHLRLQFGAGSHQLDRFLLKFSRKGSLLLLHDPYPYCGESTLSSLLPPLLRVKANIHLIVY